MDVIGLLCLLAFNTVSLVIGVIIGASIGQKVVRQEKIEMPNLNPIKAVNKAITEHKESKEKQAEDEYYKTILHNAEVYDGTATGQKKVPTVR